MILDGHWFLKWIHEENRPRIDRYVIVIDTETILMCETSGTLLVPTHNIRRLIGGLYGIFFVYRLRQTKANINRNRHCL